MNKLSFFSSRGARCAATVSVAAGFFISSSVAPTGNAAERLLWEQKPGYRVAPLNVPKSGHNGFTLLTGDQTNIRFTNVLSYARAQANQNLLNGAGVAAGDFDGDGLCDLYFCNLDGANALYRNLGNGQFEDVTARAGVACTNQASRGAVFADIDGDGKLDLLVSSLGGPNACFLNRGDRRFENVTQAAGLVLKAGGHSLTLADIDGDGDLDLYIANYGETSILRSGGTISVRQVNGRDVVTGRYASRIKIINGHMVEYGEPDALYINDGRGHFTRASWTDGTFVTAEGKPLKSAPADLGLSAMFRDINGDGFPDLYVCNDFQTPDRIWINDGKGRFRPLPDLAMRSTSHFSMGVDFADIDRDGRDDFFVGDMLSRFHKLRMTQINSSNPPPEIVGESPARNQVRRNTLLLNRGDGTYAEIAQFANVDASDWSWSVVFLDVDLDGFEDLLIANGHAYDTQDLDVFEKVPDKRLGVSPMQQRGRQLKEYPALLTPNVLFRNRGDRTFDEMGQAWGFNATNVSHGIALADLDNDGDLDVIVSCLWTPPLVYRNESSAPRVAVRLKGKPPNIQGIGAKIKVIGGAVPLQTQEIICGGRYLSADDPMRVFAAGSLTNKLRIEVTWRAGSKSVIAEALPNHIYEVDEAAASPSPPLGERAGARGQSSVVTLFEDVSQLLSHTNVDLPFNDFERQPLLHRTFSQLGPGVAWFDVDGDGHEDLLIPSGKGGLLALYKSDGKGHLLRVPDPLGKERASDDQTCVLGWPSFAGKNALLVSISTYESADTNGPVLSRIELSQTLSHMGQSSVRAQMGLSSSGPLALADIDGDGDLDVFIGGRIVPGRYPERASSQILKNNNGQLELDESTSALLRNIGLVSGAVFSDLDGDGFPELILACEWGPIRVFKNSAGKFSEATEKLGLKKFTGWWNGVTTGDFDGDGKLDIVASNWGLNSSWHRPTPDNPALAYFGDLDGNGTVEFIEADIDPVTHRAVPRRDLLALSAALPPIRDRFPTHAAYSTADMNAILGPNAASARQVQGNTLAITVFLNRGDHFEAVVLPDEAQFSAAFGVNVADFDGDGFEDIFLSQNFFAVRPEEFRQDAGRGLLLRGNGKGGFTAVSGQDSGIKIYGEQRGSAVCDYDEDGRVDLVVTQNSDQTKLYHNTTAKPGLRVRLLGPPANPAGVGATLRLKFGDALGPAREIHIGSGYYSQDSAVQVMSLPQPATQIEVHWPGGKRTTSGLPGGAMEISVAVDGSVTKVR